MTDTFRTRIPTLSDAELFDYLRNHSRYKFEAIEAAAAELSKRGHGISREELKTIQEKIRQRDGDRTRRDVPESHPHGRFNQAQVRSLARATLATGLGSAILIYFTAKPEPANPLGYDPLDTKKYLRELEVYGGKANVLGTEFRQWFAGLWHGRPLAFTVAVIAVILASGLWFISTRQSADPDADT